MDQILSLRRPKRRSHLCAATALSAALLFTPLNPAFAKGTLAGSSIENTASVSYDGPDGPVQVDSNPVNMTVNELIDVLVTSANSGDVSATPGSGESILTFVVTNNGNGPEGFTLSTNETIGGDDFDPSVVSIVIDTDGDGLYDPAIDTVYVPGSNDPLLNPDESVTIFVISSIPSTPTDGDRGELAFIATSNTGTGPAGTVVPGAGEGGSDAIIGTGGGTNQFSNFYAITSALVTLTKSAIIADPFGGTSAVPGAIITYTLIAEAEGTGSVTNVTVSDIIPTGTSYSSGTLTLDASVLTDASGDDAGTYDGTGISVDIGTMNGGDSQSVTFQVVIDAD